MIDKHTADDGDFHVGDPIDGPDRRASPAGFTIVGIATLRRRPTAWAAPASSALHLGHRAASARRSRAGRRDRVRRAPTASRQQRARRPHRAGRCRRAPRWSPATAITKEQQADSSEQHGLLHHLPAGLRRHRAVRRLRSSSTTPSRSSWPSARRRWRCCGRSAPAAAGAAVGARSRRRSSASSPPWLGLVAGVGVAAGLKALLGAIGIEIPGGPVVVTTTTIVMLARRRASVSRVGSAVAPGSSGVEGRAGRGHARRGRRRGPQLEARTVSGLVVTGARRCRFVGRALGGAGVTLVRLGALAVFVGVAVLGPVLARPVDRVIGAPLPACGASPARWPGRTPCATRSAPRRRPRR